MSNKKRIIFIINPISGTQKKDDYEKILSTFAAGEADILIGTQMIVKGHDFPMVTLVGVLAADLSLGGGDYQAGERTFDIVLDTYEQVQGRPAASDKGRQGDHKS